MEQSEVSAALAISFDSYDFYKELRRTALAPPNELVTASIRSATATELLSHLDEALHVSKLRTILNGRDALIVTVYKKAQTLEVWLSLLVPLYFNELLPGQILEMFAARFGVFIYVNGKTTMCARHEQIDIVAEGNTTLWGVVEDLTCAFAIFSTASFSTDKINIPIAFGIDIDRYAAWRFLCYPRVLEGIEINVDPARIREIPTAALFDSYAALVLQVELTENAKQSELLFFAAKTEGYDFAAGIQDGKLYVRRNSDRLELTLPAYLPQDKAMLGIAWGPRVLKLEAKTKISQPVVSVASLQTNPCFPPRKLVTWARQLRMRPEFLYENENHLFQTIFLLLEGVHDKIIISDMQSAFWNKLESGNWTPKRETDVHRVVEALLFDGCTLKNLQCLAEPRIDGGNVDFLISGTLITGATVSVCVEFKNAHAKELKHGVEVQLPAYMDSKAVDLGIYCIFYYRCEAYKSPRKGPDDLRNEIGQLIAKTGRKISPMLWDLGFRKTPSKR